VDCTLGAEAGLKDRYAEQQTAKPLADVLFTLSTHDGMKAKLLHPRPLGCNTGSTQYWQ
jgi:hypothetical protein